MSLEDPEKGASSKHFGLFHTVQCWTVLSQAPGLREGSVLERLGHLKEGQQKLF